MKSNPEKEESNVVKSKKIKTFVISFKVFIFIRCGKIRVSFLFSNKILLFKYRGCLIKKSFLKETEPFCRIIMINLYLKSVRLTLTDSFDHT